LVEVAEAFVIPVVKSAKAAATSALSMSSVAVKVRPLSVAPWPASNELNVITEASYPVPLTAWAGEVALPEAATEVKAPFAPMLPVETKLPAVNEPVVTADAAVAAAA
jgi:hypothetical protein